MKKYIKVGFLLMFFASFISYGQNNFEVVGKVFAFKNRPLSNVSVDSKKMKKTVFTDSYGIFKMDIIKKDVLTFRASGFQTFTVRVKSLLDILDVKMIYLNDASAYHEVSNGGYMTSEQLDYCIENEMSENNDYATMNSIFEIIQRENPTVKFITESGTTQIIFNSRGDTSVYASNSALLIVDGVEVNDISDIKPFHVNSVKVLTGNEAGHWGIRGSSGVIEIELKKGEL